MRYVRHKTRNSKKGENEIVFTLQPEAKVLIDKIYVEKWAFAVW